MIDHAGGDHALSKRITGATSAETRARLADIGRAQLPSVDAAKAMQQQERVRIMPGSDLQKIAPALKRGIGEYQTARNNAPAAIRTRPIVAAGPKSAVAAENSASSPAAEFLGEARAASAPAAVEMRERATASIDPGQETPIPTGRARGPETSSDHERERGRERGDPRHWRNGAGDRGTRNSRQVVRRVESGRGGGDATRA